jgi:hypothetical protein
MNVNNMTCKIIELHAKKELYKFSFDNISNQDILSTIRSLI